MRSLCLCFRFTCNPPPTPDIYTLSLHDALPISPGKPPPEAHSRPSRHSHLRRPSRWCSWTESSPSRNTSGMRSEEHTSELQSRLHLVCRLLLEKKKHYDADHRHSTPTQENTPLR